MSSNGVGTGNTPKPKRGAHRRRARPQPARRGFTSGFSTLRDLVSFILGAAIVIHEVLGPTVELFAMGAGLSLMGLPFAFAADEKRKGGDQ